MNPERVSKRLSYVLRHAPSSIGVTLSGDGWVDVDTLLVALAAHGTALTRVQLEDVVTGSDKQRFTFDPAGTRIRANQGHSVPIELGYEPRTPPDVLFHGTAASSLPAILAAGLQPGPRHAVHLSTDATTAQSVGARHGRAVVLRVDAAALAADGTVLTCAPNGVWLVEAVPPEYLTAL